MNVPQKAMPTKHGLPTLWEKLPQDNTSNPRKAAWRLELQ